MRYSLSEFTDRHHLKCARSMKWTDLARKRGTLPSILDTGTNFSRKAAPHLASFIDVL